MERSELKAKIPYGYSKKIAEIAGVEKAAVSAFLNGKNNSVKIELACLKVIVELNNERRSLYAQIQ